MPLFRWTTFQDLLTLQERMNRILEEAIRRGHLSSEDREPGQWIPSCDMFETGDAIHLNIELPGVGRPDIELQVVGDRLIIRGARPLPENASKEAFLRMERTYGPFRRDFQLPSEADPENTSAEFEDGVLVVRIPKLRSSSRTVPVVRSDR